jgi:hypothetical protein
VTSATVARGTRLPAWTGPALVGAAVVGLGTHVYLHDPARGGAFLPCPFHRITGLWCPGCGMTRAFHHLLHGDVGGALGLNLLFPVVVVLVGYTWFAWLWRALGHRPLPTLQRVPNGVWTASIVIGLVYGVLRNLPMAPFTALAP